MLIQKINKHKQKILNIITTLLLFSAIFWSFTGDKIQHTFHSFSLDTWQTGWTQSIDDEELSLNTLSEFESVNIGETLVLTNVLPTLTDDKALAFYSKDLEIHIYINDEEIYSVVTPEKFAVLESPGHFWNQIELPAEYSGDTIRIELTSQFSDRFMGTVNTLYLIEESDTINIILKQEGFRIIMTAFIFFMTIYAYINSFLWKRRILKNYFLSLARFYLTITIWLASMCSIFTYLFHQPIANMVICNLMVLIIPITAFEFYKEVNTSPNKAMRILGVILWGNFFLQFALLFICKISLLDMMPLSFLVYTIGIVGALALIFQHIYREIKCTKSERRDPEANFALITTLIFFLGALIEIIVLTLYPKRTDLIGLSSITGAVVYMIVNLIALTRHEAMTDLEKSKLEADYNHLQNTTLVQQIEAHFFYNTLNNISALCKEDPLKADQAIISFSRYMHSYMYLINERNNIPLREEVNLLYSSLEIEQAKYPDSFSYQIDIEYEDFKIPPLCLQPLVENALYHGLRPCKHHGDLHIIARKYHNAAQIIITDNGVGFDVSILDSKESIGLDNLIKRIKIMANGKVRIKSKINKGTRVTLEFPLSN